MKRIALIILIAASALAAPEDDIVDARRAALDLAGAWSNDGFKLRDGFWSGTFKPGDAKMIQVNLYAGNQDWFTLAAAGAATKVAVTIYDEQGKPVAVEPHEDGARAAAGFAPALSGSYWVKVDAIEGGAAAFALVYSYK